MKHALASLLLCSLAPALVPFSPARAEPLRVQYGMTMLGGMTLAEMEATMSIDGSGYHIETRLRPSGMARLFASGDQTSLVEGRWGQGGPEPRRYASDGNWRGTPRHTLIEYQNGTPQIRRLEPEEKGEREPVPPELAAGTLDALSVLAKLTKQVAETGKCDGTAAIYDGRRRTNAVSRTVGWEKLSPGWSNGWSGTALHCDFESRVIAGFRFDDDKDTATRPLTGRAWIAPATEGRPPMPVRVEFDTRWFGTVTAQLLTTPMAPPGRQAQGESR